MRKLDTIVLGSGISGCYSAILLKHLGKKVAVLSPKLKTKYHLPESWIFNPSKQLEELGILKDLLPSISKESQCTFLSADGKKSVMVSTEQVSNCLEAGDIVRVDRNGFDQAFFKKAQSVGVELVEFEELSNCVICESHIEVQYKEKGSFKSIRGCNLIDGSGKSAYLTNCLSLPVIETVLDSRYACFSHFEGDNLDIKTLHIIALADGYLFCIPISTNRLSIGCVVAKSCFDSTPNFELMLSSAVEEAPFVKNLITNSKRVLPVIPIKNSQAVCEKLAGDMYRIVGDAAVFMDPFFCPGIDFAVTSAEQAVLSLQENNPDKYKMFIKEWLSRNQESIYSQLESSDWNQIVRMFADPHLPYLVPIMLTQAFGQIKKKNLNFKEGITLSRAAYEYELC
ncbi:NAD(P)/FAD-dependent oxidoreductase [Candidatus Neptunichlamydia sp. REUL1]|uniref:NAD(P)/FAD-dependent oxidoreductase n=1 Tax=Candidatus Neptunichlamydia sp. REUL1 TaxID=3064277 RepID=UPI00292EAA65|nr:hypothetical protein [Candidatus Neptunochlamydia sp. REUL1]